MCLNSSRCQSNADCPTGHGPAEHLNLRWYPHPVEARTFYAPDAEPSIDLAVKVLHVSGLVDLNMPGQGGWDTFEKLTSNDPLLAVIIVTARPGQLFTALGAGVGALLEKPLDFPKLLETVRAVLAESPQVRMARLVGQHADFHYLASGGKTNQ